MDFCDGYIFWGGGVEGVFVIGLDIDREVWGEGLF